MKIFLSHSGPRSRAVAAALYDWLPRVIQSLKLFYSPGIEKGSDWSTVLDAALKDTGFGIICLTPDNLRNHWIHFEAGALFKTQGAMIWTFLHGIEYGDVPQPLGKYQHTVAEKEDVYNMLTSINKKLAEPLSEVILRDAFDKNWSELEEKLKAAESKGELAENPRKEKDILLEILETVRSQQRIAANTLFSSVDDDDAEHHFRIVLPEGLSLAASSALELAIAVRAEFPGTKVKFKKVGDTTRIEIYHSELKTAFDGYQILGMVEGITGISDLEIKSMLLIPETPF